MMMLMLVMMMLMMTKIVMTVLLLLMMMMMMMTKYPKCETSSAGFVEKGEKIMRVLDFNDGHFFVTMGW